MPFVFEFTDPEAYARAIASTGPAYEAIQAVGERSFRETAVRSAEQRMREGLPLRAPIKLVGYIAVKPAPIDPEAKGGPDDADAPAHVGFLASPPRTPEARRLFDDDVRGMGYVANVSRLWAHLPSALHGLSELMTETSRAGSLTFRQRAVLVTAAAAAAGDSYCSLAWGKKLAEASNPEAAAAVINGGAEGLDDDEKALAEWARIVARDPNALSDEDVARLRRTGFDDRQIFAVTVFVSLRLAFATVNDALGAVPDRELSESVPAAVRSAVSFGRSPEPSGEEE